VGFRRCDGIAAIRQYLRARLFDEIHLALNPVLLGQASI